MDSFFLGLGTTHWLSAEHIEVVCVAAEVLAFAGQIVGGLADHSHHFGVHVPILSLFTLFILLIQGGSTAASSQVGQRMRVHFVVHFVQF